MTTTLQPFIPGQPYLFNGLPIPSQQALPPAGQQSFAFRPACTQLIEKTIPGNPSELSWGMSYNNDFYAFSTKPAGLSQEQAYLYLDAEGNCKIQGVDVPLIPAESLPKPLLPEVATVVEDGNQVAIAPPELPLPTTSIVGVVILLCGLGVLGFGLAKRPKTATTTTGNNSALATLLELANDD